MDKDGGALRAWPRSASASSRSARSPRRPSRATRRRGCSGCRPTEAIVNRMGFNNAGAAALAARLRRLGPLPVPLGITLGKSKVTPVDEAVGDYLTSLRLLHRYADYVAVNVSSPEHARAARRCRTPGAWPSCSAR